MGIHIKLLTEDNGREVFGPVITCDYCMKVIENHKEGAYVWGAGFEEGKSGWYYPIRFYHKQTAPNSQNDSHFACRQAWDNYEKGLILSGMRPMWEELVHFPKFLSNNLGIRETDLKRAMP